MNNEVRAQLVAKAREQSERLGQDWPEVLRADAMAFLARVPEPPLYRRRQDPAQKKAQALVEVGLTVLARLYKRADAGLALHQQAIEAHLEALAHVAAGRVEAAEVPWQEGRSLEVKLAEGTGLWRKPAALPTVFDKTTGASRYDPRADALLEVKLVCPICRVVAPFALGQRVASHPLRCGQCQRDFVAYIGDVRAVQVSRTGPRRSYSLTLEVPTGHARVECHDASGSELAVAVGDKVALLYGPPSELKGLLNLSSARVLWLVGPGPCFIASALLDAQDPDLLALRSLRDAWLMPSAFGRWLVASYYAVGPQLAHAVRRQPLLKKASTSGVRAVAAGYRWFAHR
jgi:hypothetical protein